MQRTELSEKRRTAVDQPAVARFRPRFTILPAALVLIAAGQLGCSSEAEEFGEAVVTRAGRVAVVSGLGLDALPAPLAMGGAAAAGQDLDGLVLGDSVAERLQVAAGDTLRVMVPSGDPRRRSAVSSERLTVSRIVDTGTELDEALLLPRPLPGWMF